MLGFNLNNKKYEKTAKSAFKIANSLGDEVRHTMSRVTGIPETSMDVIMTASNTATTLYEYAALQFRIKLKSEIDNEYEFEAQDNQMIEAFAKVLMIPPIALHKIISKQNSPDTWEDLLHQIPLPGINADYYIDKINNLINKV